MKKNLLALLLILCLLTAVLTACTDKPGQETNPAGTLPTFENESKQQQSDSIPSEPAGNNPIESGQPDQPGAETNSSEGAAATGSAQPEETEEPVESDYNVDIGTGSAVGGG